MTQAFSVDELVPHSGSMSLLDTIDGYGDDWLEASALITTDNLFLRDDAVPAWVGIEYMAQTVAAFGGVCSRQAGDEVKIGFLLGTRRFETDTTAFKLGTRLTMRASHIMTSDSGLGSFDCTLTAIQDGKTISARAKLSVYQPDNIQDILKDSL